MKRVAIGTLASAVLAILALSSSAGAANECDGLTVCVPVSGPWVVVPVSGSVPRPHVEFELACPPGYVAGGLDARLSDRAIDVSFAGSLGSPVNPGITTSREVVFAASYVGSGARGPSFRPFVGCIPARGGGARVPTSVAAVRPGRPTVRHVRTVPLRPGSTTITQGCAGKERLVGAAHAVGFFTRTPPGASLVRGVATEQRIQGERVVVGVRADAELTGVSVVVQVLAVCARLR